MSNILSFDVGTTAMKCILYSQNFEEDRVISKEYSLETEGDMVRLNAEVYFECFCQCIKEILNSGVPKDDISAVAFTTQGETLIPVDKSGKALSKAIVWLDTSAGKEADFIKSRVDMEEFYKTTGLCSIDGALPVAKIMHIKNSDEELYSKTYKFLFLEDYLISRLCGRFVSEKSIQSSSGWYDIINECLYDKIFTVCDIDKNKIPDILTCGTNLGDIGEKGSLETGLSSKTKIITAAMDQIASAIGAGNICEGIVTETTGTALVVGASVKTPEMNFKNPITVYKHYNDMFIYMPYFQTAGIVHKWFRDTLMTDAVEEAKLKAVSPYTLMENEARLSPPGSSGLIFNPDFVSGGTISGLNLSTKISDLNRSVLEGISYVLRELLESVKDRGITVKEVHSLGGGAYSDFWCQIKSDVCKAKIKTSDLKETTALGAAILASVSLGFYKDVNEALSFVKRNEKSFYPQTKESNIYDLCYKKYKNLKE